MNRARTMRKAMAPKEAKLWKALRALKPLGWHFRRQVLLGPYYADFACHHARIVVEVDGATHTNPGYDARRDDFMRSEGYAVLRVTNTDVRDNVAGVIDMVLAMIEEQPKSTEHRRLAPPSPRWGGIEGGVGPLAPDDRQKR